MQHEEREPDRSQDDENAKTKDDALAQDALQKRTDGNVYHERPHDIVELPFRLVRLKSVVAVHATLFARERWVDGPKHPLIVDGQELG